ncbi:transcription termination factor MTEF1, chloroplastic-like [Chenopodium quinoa]|nr:transcription termination factor MTEF1, chloroplastic-like [Chenopodium quinoa]
MQDTLNFPTTTGKLLKPNFLPKTPSFLRRKTTIFPTLSSKTTTIHPLKPPKIQPLPSSAPNSHPKTTIPTSSDPEFEEKTLFLDSIGLDSLSLLPPSAIAAASSLSDLKTLFDYLSSLGFSPPHLRRITTMCPEILSLRLHNTAPVFAFLLREVKVPAHHLPRVICRRPRLLVSDVETRLRPTLYFLQSIGIHEVYKHTDLLSASVEDKYLPKIEYFEKVGFAYHDSVSMFRRFPALFCYSVKDNFEPKYNYFVVEMGRDLKELKEFPQYFSFSLEKRIKPRHQCCVERGVCFPLPLMLKMKDEDFRKRLDVCCNSSMPKSNSPLWGLQICK